MIEAHPLHWPEGRPRTKRPTRSRFDTSFADARDDLVREIKLLGGQSIVISTNISLRRDGLPYASEKEPDDSGVAVYFTYGEGQQCFACDRWDLVKDNIQAIRKTIEALRGIARWGTGDMMERAFTGFTALPGPDSAGGHHWSDILGTHALSTNAEIRQAYRRRCREYHPDTGVNGGDSEMFHAVQNAWEQAKSERDL